MEWRWSGSNLLAPADTVSSQQTVAALGTAATLEPLLCKTRNSNCAGSLGTRRKRPLQRRQSRESGLAGNTNPAR